MHCFFEIFAPQSVTRGRWLSLLRKAKPRSGQLPGSEVRFGSGTSSSALLIEKNVNVPPVPTSVAPPHPLSDRILLETDTLVAPLCMQIGTISSTNLCDLVEPLLLPFCTHSGTDSDPKSLRTTMPPVPLCMSNGYQ